MKLPLMVSFMCGSDLTCCIYNFTSQKKNITAVVHPNLSSVLRQDKKVWTSKHWQRHGKCEDAPNSGLNFHLQTCCTCRPCKPQRLGFPDTCSKPGPSENSDLTEPILGSKLGQKATQVSGNQPSAWLTLKDNPTRPGAADPALVPA